MSDLLESSTIIVPPPAIRTVLHKTADFIASKGPAVEERIRREYREKPSFSFLLENDPFYPYFKHCVQKKKNENGKSEEKTEEPKKVGPTEQRSSANISFLKSRRSETENEHGTPTATNIPKFSIPNLKSLPSKMSLDVILLMAEYVALYGESFYTSVSQKETRNGLFEFLNPLHAHHPIFREVVKAYECLFTNPKNNEVEEMTKKYADRWQNILKDVWKEYNWECGQAERELPNDDKSATDIDWYDFVVLDTVSFDENDVNLPAPISDAKRIPQLLAIAEKDASEREKNKSYVDMEIDDLPADANVSFNVAKSSVVPKDLIRTRPRIEEKKQSRISVMLPSGQKVPLTQAEASMKAELIDRSYKDERERAAEKNRLQNLAGGEEVARNLARLDARRAEVGVYNRADLQQELSELPTRKLAEVDKQFNPAPQTGPQLPAASTKNRKDQVEAAVDALSAVIRPKPPSPKEEKRAPTVLPGLVPGEEWLKTHGSSAAVKIIFPKHANKEWDLRGQTVEMKVPLKRSVGKLKNVIHKMSRVPVNKQKLFIEGRGFLKDDTSLASYNVRAGDIIGLEVKERGKRKRN